MHGCLDQQQRHCQDTHESQNEIGLYNTGIVHYINMASYVVQCADNPHPRSAW